MKPRKTGDFGANLLRDSFEPRIAYDMAILVLPFHRARRATICFFSEVGCPKYRLFLPAAAAITKAISTACFTRCRRRGWPSVTKTRFVQLIF